MSQPAPEPAFNAEQVEKFRNAFDSFDPDRDGLVSVQRLAELLHAVGFAPRIDEVEDMIEDISAPTFEFKSFLYVISRHRRASNAKQELIDALRLWDRTGTRMLTTTKIWELLSSLKKPFTPDEIAELLGHPRNFVEAKTDSVNYEDFVNLIFDVL
jgi:Ca2+-binding EF-hand superfamily protein